MVKWREQNGDDETRLKEADVEKMNSQYIKAFFQDKAADGYSP